MLVILSTSLFTEITAMFFLSNHKGINTLYSLSYIIHHSFWIVLIGDFLTTRKIKPIAIIIFLTFSLGNLLFIEGPKLNYLTFIAGALIYLVLFIFESFTQLKNENLSFFKSNTYLLLFAPVLFFLGFSFLFGFRNFDLRNTIVFGKTDLYTFICYFVNIIYYSLINLYIYKEQKLKND